MRRALHRRIVRVLLCVALVGCALFGVIAWVGSSGQTVAELQRGDGSPALLSWWWRQDIPDGVPIFVFFFLLIGGVIGGASVVGAEWKANTVTTLLTWEPRRTRVLVTRLAAGAILSFVIAIALQLVFMAAAIPAVLAHGSTATSGIGWWWSLGFAVLRIALMTAVAAITAEALAMLGRNTAFALVILFGWIAVVEGVVRGLKPGWSRWLWGENVAIIVPWRAISDGEFQRGPLTATITILVYATAICVLSGAVFRRRDIAAAS
jgi:ABC-type transport system involved in multi-copper enzyme maturation permease subunit